MVTDWGPIWTSFLMSVALLRWFISIINVENLFFDEEKAVFGFYFKHWLY